MDFGFERAHGYVIEKGFITDCASKEDAIRKITNGEYSDIIDEFEIDILTEGYEITDMWELE